MHFTTFRYQTCNFTNFRTLFNAVVMNFTISIFIKNLSTMQLVHSFDVFSFVYFRQYSMEKELHSLLWKIDSGEISYEARRNSQVSIESGVGNQYCCIHVKLW